MKLKTALEKAQKIAERLSQCNGVFITENATHKKFVITKAWLFGSTVKGKENPSDVDILYEGKTSDFVEYIPSYTGQHSKDIALKKLRHGMKMVRLHDYYNHHDFGDIAATMIEIFPVNKLTEIPREK